MEAAFTVMISYDRFINEALLRDGWYVRREDYYIMNFPKGTLEWVYECMWEWQFE